MSGAGRDPGDKTSLELDVAALRARLGPVKVALIEQWIREVVGPFDAAIAAQVRADSVVVDAGCSRGDPDLPSLSGGRLHVGADEDLAGLRANRLADAVVCAPLRRLPFADGSVDVVVCKWVAEHLEEPAADFAECRRVLRAGGHLCLLTPNKYSCFTFFSALLSFRMKQRMKRWMFGLHEEDTFPTWYRANSRGALRRLLGGQGFAEAHFARLPGMWTFFIFSPALARLVRALEHFQARIPGLRANGTYLLGVWRKEGA